MAHRKRLPFTKQASAPTPRPGDVRDGGVSTSHRLTKLTAVKLA